MAKSRRLFPKKQELAFLSGLVVIVALTLGIFKNIAAETTQQMVEANQDQTREAVTVEQVVDGDTIVLEDGRTVRYIGIDTPETKHPSQGQECFGQEASFRNKQLVEGKVIQLEKDVSETDRYGRILRYVWLDNQMINQVLVEEGYAYAASFPPDIKHQDQLTLAEAEARELRRGLWSACNVARSNESDHQVLGTSTDNTLPTDCTIKGNISENGKLYHLPGCDSYNQVVISQQKGERWFCSESDALSAGWTKAGNC